MIEHDPRPRCAWGEQPDPAYRAYHDLEWGVPVRDERHLFELLILEGAQAGLSWSTILHKRDGYRRAFAGFDPVAVAAYGDDDAARLLADPGIVRNRAKVTAAIGSARAVLALHEAGTSLAELLWSFVGGQPLVNRFGALGEIPAETETSRAMTSDLRRRGFRFVGPTICYALMQSAGLVNDHEVTCYRWAEVQRPGSPPRARRAPDPPTGGAHGAALSALPPDDDRYARYISPGRASAPGAPGVAQLHPAAAREDRAAVDAGARLEQQPDRHQHDRDGADDLPGLDGLERDAQRDDHRRR